MERHPTVDEILIYHNPRCSKSREALALLERRGVQPCVVEYMKNPLGRDELKRLLALLGISARELLRSGEASCRERGLNDETVRDAAIIEAMSEDPRLMQRPIVVRGKRALVARPPERALELLE